MGVVYAGIDDAGRRAAVKLIHPELAQDPEFRGRFVREIALLRRVAGVCTVRMLQADGEAHQPWLAAEYVPGSTLTQHVNDKGPLTGEELTGLATGLAEALRSMHSTGVVHRDLKPSNVILSPIGPRVVDMGIARALDETSITRTGIVVGSPGWISPEEYRGDEVGPAADIYGWALLLLYAITGRLVYGAGRPEVLAMRVLSETPDVSGVPEPLRELVERALRKDPNGRPSADEIVKAVAATWSKPAGGSADPAPDEVTRFLDQTWVMPADDEPEWIVPKVRRRTRLVMPAIMAGAVTIIMAAAAVVAIRSGDQERPSAVVPSTAAQALSVTSPVAERPSAKSSAAPAPSPTPSATSASAGRRVKLNMGFSFILPADWSYTPDPTVGPDTTCLYPKSEESKVSYCGHHGIAISPWFDGVDLSMWNIDDPDSLNDPISEGPCGRGNLLRKGKMLKSGLHRIGDRRAYYRHARSYCKDGSTVEAEFLFLPLTRLTVTIEKISAEHRLQAESILRSFKFPNKAK